MTTRTRSKAKGAKAAKLPGGKQAGAKEARLFQNPSRKGKVRKEFWLDPDLLDAAKRQLGASSEREAVEIALDLVAFRKELLEGSGALARIPLSRID